MEILLFNVPLQPVFAVLNSHAMIESYAIIASVAKVAMVLSQDEAGAHEDKVIFRAGPAKYTR